MRSFEETAAEVYGVSYRVAYRLTGRRVDAEDVAQEVAARACLRWPTIEGYAEAWAARAASNLVIDQLRRDHRRRRSLSLVEQVDSSVSERLDLVRALQDLPRRQRDVLVLRYLADLPEAMVAARLGCSVGAVKQHAHRALAALRVSTYLSATESP